MRTIITLAILLTASSLCAEVIAPNGSKRLEYRTSWIGNTFGGLNPETGKGQWVQPDIAAMCVTPDGTVYTNALWEEAGSNCMMYKDGKMLAAAMDTHGRGASGGKAIAVNDKYVFIALRTTNDDGKLDWHGISRRLRSDFTKDAPFDIGEGESKSFLVVNALVNENDDSTISTDHAAITGLWADNERLYVANPLTNRIEIYDAETMKKLTKWNLKQYNFSEPGQIAADQKGNIWVYLAEFTEGENPRKYHTITQFDRDGKKMKGRISDDGAISAVGPFCFGPENKMYVFNGIFGIFSFPLPEDGDVFIFSYDVDDEEARKKALESVKLIGLTNVMQGALLPVLWQSGEFGDLRFSGGSVKALGCDAAGNLYIAQDFSTSGGGAVLESYKLTGKEKQPPMPHWNGFLPALLDAELNWRLFGLCFIDCATLDPDDETIVYTKDKKFKLDWSQTEPGREWSFIGTTLSIDWLDPRFRIKNSAGIRTRTLDPANALDKTIEVRKLKLQFTVDEDERRDLIASIAHFKGEGKEEWKEIDKERIQAQAEGERLIGEIKELDKKIEIFRKESNPDDTWSDKWSKLHEEREKKMNQLLRQVSLYGIYRLLFVNDQNAGGLQVYTAGFTNIDYPMAWYEMTAYLSEQKPDFDDGESGISQEESTWIDTGASSSDKLIAQGWWVDSDCNVWRASETQGIRRFANDPLGRKGKIWESENFLTFPHPAEFKQVKRIRYYPESDTLYLGGCATVEGREHKNQHWKPMGPVLCRYDNFLKGNNPGKTEGKLRWKIVLPYVVGSQGHESCEPMGFDVAGDYIFVPYTGASREAGFKTGHVEVFRTADASSVGWMEPDPKTVGEVGLQDIRECLSAHKLKSGEYVVFLEDDYKAKVVMYRWLPK
jgi:hypothetical protein